MAEFGGTWVVERSQRAAWASWRDFVVVPVATVVAVVVVGDQPHSSLVAAVVVASLVRIVVAELPMDLMATWPLAVNI